MLDDETRAIRHMYQTDFGSFIQFAFRTLYPKSAFLSHWSIELLGHVLEKCHRRETSRLIVNMPPRTLKSFCTSVAFPAWVLARRPESKILCISGSQGLAEDHFQLTQHLLASARYRSLFPHVRFTSSARRISLPHGGSLSVFTPSGRLTGRGADLVIIDDPQAPHEAEDAARVQAIHTWYDRNIYQRLDDKRRGVVIVVMQRLAPDDLAGHLLKQKGWELLKLPALATEDESYPGFRGGRVLRQKGEALHPARESREQLRDALLHMKARAFMAQYQQSPYSESEGLGCGVAAHLIEDPDGLEGGPFYYGPIFMQDIDEQFLLHEVFGESSSMYFGSPPPMSDEKWLRFVDWQERELAKQRGE